MVWAGWWLRWLAGGGGGVAGGWLLEDAPVCLEKGFTFTVD